MFDVHYMYQGGVKAGMWPLHHLGPSSVGLCSKLTCEVNLYLGGVKTRMWLLCHPGSLFVRLCSVALYVV